jgi:hypothetical protein
MSCVGIGGQRVFMPTILALHIALVSAGGAMVCARSRSRTGALAACGWLALSPLVTLGVTYQLIGQVLGLVLLAGAAVLLLSPDPGAGPGSSWRRASAGAALVAAIGFCYPEVFPFLALAFCLYHAVAIARGRENWKTLSRFAAVLAGLSIVLLNTYGIGAVLFLQRQVHGGIASRTVDRLLFPYYLVPRGLAVLWGFQPFAGNTSHPAIDVYIALGACLLVAGAAAALWMTWRGEAAGAVSAVMLALAVRLFFTRSDYGLFKLAMFVQPFLLATMTLAWFSLGTRAVPRKKWTARKAAMFCVPIALLAALGIPAQRHYVRASVDSSSAPSGLVEIPGATTEGIVMRLTALAAKPRRDVVISDAANVMLATFATPYFAPSSEWYPAEVLFAVGTVDKAAILNKMRHNWYVNRAYPGYTAMVYALLRERAARFKQAAFDMRGSPANGFWVESNPAAPEFPAQYTLLASGSRQTVLNRSSDSTEPEGPLIRLVPSEQVRNRLVLVDSDLGRNYYLAAPHNAQGSVAMFQLEPDYFVPGRSMAAIGRVLLFQVLNPSGKVRLVLDYTASLRSDGSNEIPQANAIGEARAAFAAAGRGSARLFSAPVTPQAIEGRYYVSLDMGGFGRRYEEKRTGLVGAFGAAIPLDSRTAGGFARDISAIGEDRFAALRPPSMLSHFPADLSDASLEYSGIYEDGWVAESSYCSLLQPPMTSVLRIRAIVPPQTPQPSALQVVVGGATVAAVALRTGENDLRLPLAGVGAIERVELHFDRAARLPSPDNRPVSALLRSIGFEAADVDNAEIAGAPVAIGNHWYPFEKFGGHTFRWVDNDAQFRVHLSGSEKGRLGIEVESGPGLASKPFRLELRGEGQPPRVLAARGGREVLSVPVVLHGGDNGFSLHISGGGLPTPNDPRSLNFRVFSITWTPQH